MSVSLVYNLTFTRAMMDRPILHDLGRNFEVVLTLRRAMLSESGGWAEVGFAGEPGEINRAVSALQTFGVTTMGPIHASNLVEAESGEAAAVGRGT